MHKMEYYSAIEWNEIGSIVETQINLETIIQNEISQKKKILCNICEIQKDGINDLICKIEIDTQTQRTNSWTSRREMGVG